jgi:GTP cyclohydrolase II
VAEDFLVKVAEQVERIVEPLESTADYLRTKREKMGHLLDR